MPGRRGATGTHRKQLNMFNASEDTKEVMKKSILTEFCSCLIETAVPTSF